jgi:hypothetical protein
MKNIENILSNIPKEILIHCVEQLLMKKNKSSNRVCVKVGNLRKLYGPDINFKKWLENSNNIYVGRYGRIFIDKIIFNYKGSKWANPYTIKQYNLDECIRLYKEYIIKKIETDSNYNLDELRNKTLGCWCNPKDKCHVDVLLSLLNNFVS